MPTRQSTAERARSSIQTAATSTFLLPLGRTATSTEALIPAAFHPLADSVPPSFRMLPHRRSDDASPRMPVNYEFESVKAAGYTVGLRSRTPFAPGWVPHRNAATLPQHQTLSSPRNMSPRPLVPLSPNTASFRHEMRQLPLPPPLTAASHAVHAAHAGAHADVRRAHAIHVARVMQWDRSMKGLSRSATSLGPPSTAYGSPRPLAGAIAAMDPAIGAIHAMHAAARTANVKVRLVDVSGLRPSASLPALAHAPSLSYSHFAKAPIIDGRAMTPMTEQTTQLVARYQPAGYALPAPMLSEHHAMQVAKSALSRTRDESHTDPALEGACRPWTGTEGGGGSSGGSGARAAAKASGTLPPPLADYDAAPAAAYPSTAFSSLDRPRAAGPSGRRAPATGLLVAGPAVPDTARAEGLSFPTGFPSEAPSASQHSHSQPPAALTGFKALRSLDSPPPAVNVNAEPVQPAAYGGVNVNDAAYGGGWLGGLESMAGPAADDGSWPGADAHILDADAHLDVYTWPAEQCAQYDASLSGEMGAELGMPAGPGEDQPGRHSNSQRGKFRIIGPAKDAHYGASLWAMKFGARGKSMQERMLEEAKRRRGKQVNLSDVTKGLLLNRRIVAALRACTVFHGLDSLHLSMMAYGGLNMRMKRYGVVYRAGAAASSFFVLTHGSVQIVSEDGPPQTITVERGARQGIAFGLESLGGLGSGGAVSGGSGLCRQATVCALEASSLVVFSTKDMRLDEGRLERLADRIFAETAAAALRITPVFADLTPAQLASLAPLFEFGAFNPNTPFFSAGGACDKLFILLNGSMVISQRSTTIATLHSTVGEGSTVWHPFVGAEGLLDAETRRPYDVVTCTPANALVLPAHALKRFLKSVPNLYDRLQEFSEMRRKAWELECGLSLSLEYDSVPEAAQNEDPAQDAD